MITTILRKRNSIIIQYRVNGKQFRVYTGIHCKPNEWNKKNKSILDNSECSTSSNQLIKSYRNEIESYINDIKRKGETYKHNSLKDHIKHNLSAQDEQLIEKDLFYAFNLFIESKKAKYAPVTITSYKNSLSHIKNYWKNGTLQFEEMNRQWFDNYIQYLKTKLSHSTGTRSNQIKNIKSVLNFAHELELHDNTKYQSIRKEKSIPEKIYLSDDDIKQLCAKKYSDKIEEKFVDAFIFICLTGLRFSDFKKITKDNFEKRNDYWFLNFVQSKTKKQVSAPIIYKKAYQILLKYDFNLPKYSNAYFNRRLKEIFKKHNLFSSIEIIHTNDEVKKHIKRNLITVHTGRRSFATNQFLKNIPINLIMAATGHETEKAFRTYIKANEIEKSKALIKYTDY
jgi:integrase